MKSGTGKVTVAHKNGPRGASSVMLTENGKLVTIVNRLNLCAAGLGIEVE